MVTSPITPCIVVEAKVDFMKARWHLWWKQTIKRDLNVSLFIRKKHQASWRFPWMFVKNDPCFHDRNEEQSRNCCETWRLKFAEVYLTRACLRSPQVQRNLKKIKTFCNKTCPQSQKLLSESQVTSLPSTKQLKTRTSPMSPIKKLQSRSYGMSLEGTKTFGKASQTPDSWSFWRAELHTCQ